MGRETNIDSIRILEEQIREHERAVIRLKRARNSLLSVSKLPPELLGKIFHCNVAPKSDFDGLNKRSHNFLLVCHHWFEVASHTPDLWSFWGNTPKDWTRWYRRSGTAPLDLVLGQPDYGGYYDDNDYVYGPTLRDVLQDRATRDAIRRVHLTTRSHRLLSSIVKSLTSNHEEPRSIGMESFVLRNDSQKTLDVSNFFARYRFPKLQRLDLSNCVISSWNHLTSRTSVLMTLFLDLRCQLTTPTISRLLSVLASNPALRKVGLINCAVPGGGGGESSVRVQLHHLKELLLDGDLRRVIRLLDHLDHSRNIDNLSLTLYNSDVADITQTVGPYLRDHLHRRDRPQNGLNLHVSSDNPIVFRAGDAGGIDFSAPEREQINTFFGITLVLKEVPPKGVLERAALDLIVHAPLEEVVYLHAHNVSVIVEDTHTRFPNLRALSFDTIPLRAAFPNPSSSGYRWTLPSLEHVLLDRVSVDHIDWSPLMTFLAYRVSSGNPLDTLAMAGAPHVCVQVVKDIRDAVREFKIDRLASWSFSCLCQRPW